MNVVETVYSSSCDHLYVCPYKLISQGVYPRFFLVTGFGKTLHVLVFINAAIC